MIADSYMLGALASKALSAPLRNEADAGRSPQAELSPLQDASFFQDYINGALIALIAYEHIITFDAEIRVIWGRRRTLPAILFVINRYNLLLDAIVLLQIYLRLDLTVRLTKQEPDLALTCETRRASCKYSTPALLPLMSRCIQIYSPAGSQ
ncbi:hypothetical protein PsYK624_099740 [Phanerochaete sordida]|uniref:DUF6533 domain-containing protein n=1 Tax=Phanerochaete sordida TaxID=48140 RepID=A0A9P3GFC7_9APHY|nr:hypothetical protein PsYK624_099740 [Phanerochaete sordida]